VPGLFILFSRWQTQTGRRLEQLLHRHWRVGQFPKSTHFIEIYFDLISASFSFFCLGVQCQTFLLSSVFVFIFFLYCLRFLGRVFGMRPARAFGQRLNSQIDGNLFLGQLYTGIVCCCIVCFGYPANDFIVLDVLMWALIVLFECHYVQALGTERRTPKLELKIFQRLLLLSA